MSTHPQEQAPWAPCTPPLFRILHSHFSDTYKTDVHETCSVQTVTGAANDPRVGGERLVGEVSNSGLFGFHPVNQTSKQHTEFFKCFVYASFLYPTFQVDLRLPVPQLHAEQIRAVAGHQRGRPDR